MKHLRITILLLLLMMTTIAANAQRKKGAQTDSQVTSLIAAVVKQNSASSRTYLIIQIGSTEYLVRGSLPKIIKSRPAGDGNAGGSGMCQGYAYVYMYASNLKMQSVSDGEGGIWKSGGTSWKKITAPEGGVWSCAGVKNIPKRAKKCLEITECY